MKFWIPGTEDPTLDGLPLARSGLYFSCAYPTPTSGDSVPKSRRRSIQVTRDPLMLAYWERILNGLVYELYFPKETHEAGLRMFDLVEASVGQTFLSAIPSNAAIPSKDADRNVCATFLTRLRQKFEKLHDGAHPLRLALDKLQTLDVVRIIEGKT